MSSWERTILHVDMDAFFASVEQRDFPELRGKPVVVGGDKERGVVAAASYEARKFGVRSAMSSVKAKKLCPELIFQKGRMQVYSDVSKKLMAILESYSPEIQKLSVDEAFLDVSGSIHLWGGIDNLVQALRSRIRDELHLTASVGIAPNKFLAKLASDVNKPDGQTRVPDTSEEIIAWLGPMDISRIWGVGKQTEAKLNKYAIRKVKDIQQKLPSDLEKIVGASAAEHLFQLANGMDERPIVTVQKDKSISSESTFNEDHSEPDYLHQRLLELTEKVGRRLRASGKYANTVFIKVRFKDFETITRQRSLPFPTHKDIEIFREVTDLFSKVEVKMGIRLLGVGVSNLGESELPEQYTQLDFFETPRELPDSRIDQAVDTIREKYGKEKLKRGNWET